MPYLTNLAAIARKTGYTVVEVPGWRTRGHGPMSGVAGVVCHHTAGWNDMHVVRDGRPGLAGPLSQFWLSRSGTIYVVAAGRCWQNAPSTSANHMNHNSIGIETENDGRTPWPSKQLDSYKKLCAELCKAFGLSASRVVGHKEVNRGKIDPHSINMNNFRRDVADLMKAPEQTWTDKLMKNLPTINPGDEHRHVKTVRCLLFARGYAPKDLYSFKYDDDLIPTVNAFKKAHGRAQDGIWGYACWEAALNLT